MKNSNTAAESNEPTDQAGVEINRVAAMGDGGVPPEAPSAGAPTVPAPAPDVFEKLKGLRINQAFLSGAAEKFISSYSVRKPKPNSFFRVNPDEEYVRESYIYTDKDEGGMDRETYLVDMAFALQLDEALWAPFRAAQLRLAIERHASKPFVWPLRFPVGDRKDNEYWRTARENAERAETEWISIIAKEGSYDWSRPISTLPEPVWTKVPFTNILRLAFKGLVIDSIDHPVMKELLGAI